MNYFLNTVLGESHSRKVAYIEKQLYSRGGKVLLVISFYYHLLLSFSIDIVIGYLLIGQESESNTKNPYGQGAYNFTENKRQMNSECCKSFHHKLFHSLVYNFSLSNYS